MEKISLEDTVSQLESIVEKRQIIDAEMNEVWGLLNQLKGKHIHPNYNPESTLKTENVNISLVKLRSVLEHLKSCSAEIRSAYESVNVIYTAVKAEKESEQ
jgi:hypothetical protein